MRTYVRMIFSTEGVSPEEIVPIMHELGFEEAFGMHDFQYKWNKQAKMEDVLKLIGKMHRALKGTHIRYEVTTVM
ncbi:MAG: hypothetical protein ACP5JR_00185 [Thermoplasmata archaeon]